MIVYDTEIQKAIPKGELDPTIEYCGGWDDLQGMGISVICALDTVSGEVRVFGENKLKDFGEWVGDRQLGGFNTYAFDDHLLAANGIEVKTNYDLLREIRKATGQPEDYTKGVTKAGYSLDAITQATFGYGKSGDGANAAILYQKGQWAELVDYCLRDVWLTARIIMNGWFTDPHSGERVELSR